MVVWESIKSESKVSPMRKKNSSRQRKEGEKKKRRERKMKQSLWVERDTTFIMGQEQKKEF